MSALDLPPLALPSPDQPPLDAATLDAAALSAVAALLAQGEAANTTASYRSALRYWAAWFALRYRVPIALPVPVPAVLQFIVDHVERDAEAGRVCELPAAVEAALVAGGYKGKPGAPALSTVTHRVAVLSKLHTLHGHPNPCRDAAVRELLAKARRGHAQRGALPRRKAALTREPLEALLATCDDTLRGKRDRALLLFAWASGGRRRAEVAAATCENVHKVGERVWVYTLAQSKGNQAADDRPENDKPIAGAAADALEAWLASSRIASGPLFRRIRHGDHVGEPLTPAALRRIVMARCALAGIEGNFSAHSLRSGFVTEAGRQNVPLGDIMAMTGHASVATVMRYYRSGATVTSRVVRLIDAD